VEVAHLLPAAFAFFYEYCTTQYLRLVMPDGVLPDTTSGYTFNCTALSNHL
jgi:hypothetical protein